MGDVTLLAGIGERGEHDRYAAERCASTAITGVDQEQKSSSPMRRPIATSQRTRAMKLFEVIPEGNRVIRNECSTIVEDLEAASCRIIRSGGAGDRSKPKCPVGGPPMEMLTCGH